MERYMKHKLLSSTAQPDECQSQLDATLASVVGASPVPGEYLTGKELNDRYNIPPRTAQRWRVSGCGPRFVRAGPRRILYRLSDVEAWLAARTFRHRADELSRSAG
jgi:hypothetical protein